MAPDVTLKAITAYRRFSNSFGRNSSGSPLPINYTWDTSNHHQCSEEITLTGTALQKLDWTVGGFYYDGTDSNQGFSSLFYLVPFLAAASFNDYDIQTTKDYAGFLHGVYHFTDQLSLEVGVRYTSDKKHAVIFRQDFAGDRHHSAHARGRERDTHQPEGRAVVSVHTRCAGLHPVLDRLPRRRLRAASRRCVPGALLQPGGPEDRRDRHEERVVQPHACA